MLPQWHFAAFNDTKPKNVSNALRITSLYVISYKRQPVAQELDKIHILHARKFWRPISGVGISEQACYSASIERVLVYVRNA